ncbi:MAG: hypothetical protein AB1791_07995 [Chloroflexota bacterium]
MAFSNGEPFATGLADYTYHSPTPRELEPRLILQIAFEGFEAAAILDTGAPYVICAPAVARQVGFAPTGSLGQIRLLVRGASVSGRLYRSTVTFPAILGVDLSVDATVFVPDPDWEESWGDLPSFIGLGGCLERMRFAIDPGSDTFYFGPLA